MSIFDALIGAEVDKRLAVIGERIKAIEEQIAATRARLEDIKVRMDLFHNVPGDKWLPYQDRIPFEILTGDLFQAFAIKAMELLATTHPSLVPLKITDDRSRIPTLAKFAQSIPGEVYETWGLPGYREIIGERFSKSTRVTKPPCFTSNHYDLAQMLHSSYNHPNPRREREILNPVFMFVHGKSLEEMNEVRKAMAPNHHSPFHDYRMQSMQSNPWSAEVKKQPWRETGKRGKRSGGKKGRRVK
ncbi:MAG: hypothetical protein Q9221_003002 [Calogaya cf. arnoldii]